MLCLRKWTIACILACVALSATAAYAQDPTPPDWNSFKAASFFDIYLTPSLATDQLTYTLTLGPTPTFTSGGNTYNVNWVKAYFVVDEPGNGDFTATNGTVVTDWMWEENYPNGHIAGWHDGNDTLLPGQSKALGFESFVITGSPDLLSGLHIGYQDGSNVVTDWYKGTLAPIPEPSSILGLLLGLGGLAWRRRR